MITKLFSYFLIAIFVFSQANFVLALSSASDFTVTDMRNPVLWRNYIYIPVLNVMLPSALGGSDELHAITVKNFGSADAGESEEIKTVRIWRDDGDTAFDPRLDKEIGEAVWDGTDSWDISGLSESYTSSLSVFATIDTSSSATASTTVRFAIPRLSDANGNGEYDSGDEGVFFKSDNDGPSDGEVANGRTDTFSTSSALTCTANKFGPRTPTDFFVARTGKSGELNITWKNPPDIDLFAVTIYRSINPDIIGNAQYSGITNETKLDTGLVDNTNYYYTLKAFDTCNNESFPTAVVVGVASNEPLPQPAPPDNATTTEAEAKGPSGAVRDGNKILATVSPQTDALISEGDLIRGEDGIKVYIVKNGYVRWIQSPAIMGMYGHFQWLNVKAVSNTDLNKFYESALIRADGDEKVYKVDSQGKKQWLNMTAAEFESAGYRWDAIYVINNAELDWYTN